MPFFAPKPYSQQQQSYEAAINFLTFEKTRKNNLQTRYLGFNNRQKWFGLPSILTKKRKNHEKLQCKVYFLSIKYLLCHLNNIIL